MARYWVMTNYGAYEGWKRAYCGESFDEAVKWRETQMGMGNSEVLIFKEVELVVTEADEETQRVRQPMVGHNCPELANSFAGTIEIGDSCKYCGWVASATAQMVVKEGD